MNHPAEIAQRRDVAASIALLAIAALSLLLLLPLTLPHRRIIGPSSISDIKHTHTPIQTKVCIARTYVAKRSLHALPLGRAHTSNIQRQPQRQKPRHRQRQREKSRLCTKRAERVFTYTPRRRAHEKYVAHPIHLDLMKHVRVYRGRSCGVRANNTYMFVCFVLCFATMGQMLLQTVYKCARIHYVLHICGHV